MNAATPIAPGLEHVPSGIDLRLWRIDLDAPPPAGTVWPDAVRQRAARFVRERDGRRYLASQAALRALVADGAAADGGGGWHEGAHGKPALAAGRPHFNASRRDGWGLVGLSHTHELGVDIETLRPIDDARELAALHFTPREREAVDDSAAFLRVWTRKEACMKATGLGLALAPSSFECGARPEPRELRVSADDRTWTLLVHTPDAAADGAPVVASWAVVLA